MAKNVIEKAPFKFNIELFNTLHDPKYVSKYKDVDSKGRYLYWDTFKWHLDEEDNPKKAWFATKWARLSKKKEIQLVDKTENHFLFCIPDILQSRLYKILKLSGQGIVPVESIKSQYLISSLITEEAISSSQLEGASTTRKVAKEMLLSEKKPMNEDEEMILNNYLLMKELKNVKYSELSVDMILSFHSIATRGNNYNGNIAGELRKTDDIIITDGVEDNILHHPPEYKVLPKRLRLLCDFANETHDGENGSIFIDPIIKAIILHFMIGYEHPFSDGNGRTARALFYWYMLKQGFDYFEYISISKLLKKAPKQYGISYLYSEFDDNDLTYFIMYQTDIIMRAIKDLLEYLEEKSKIFTEINLLLKDSKLSKKLNYVQKDVLKKSLKSPGRQFKSDEIIIDYDVTANTARKYLNDLVKYKLLVQSKEGKHKVYIAPANLLEIIKAT